MEKIKVCKSYGVLAHEKRPVYSQYPASDIYDVIYIKVPDGFEAWESESGEIIVKQDGGFTYRLDEILTNARNSDKPVFRWVDRPGHYQSAKLEVIE